MLRKYSRQLKATVACTLIALAGAAVGGWSYRERNSAMRLALLEDARRSTVAFAPSEVARLAGTPDDALNPVFAGVQYRLRHLKSVDPRVRKVYIVRVDVGTGRVTLLADSGLLAAGSADPRSEALRTSTSPVLQELIRSGEALTEGPQADASGTWVTAYAIIGHPGATGDILGVDVDAAGWRRELWQAALQGTFFVWTALGLPLLAWFVARRQIEQSYVIRNLSQAVEQSHSAIIIIGLDNRIEFANRGLCEQIGYAREELIGRNWQDFRVTETSEEVLADLVSTVRAGRPWEGEWFNRRQNGAV